MHKRISLLLLVVLTALGASRGDARMPGKRRALLIGINDYTASRLGIRRNETPAGRDWPNLLGAVNDVGIIEQLLIGLYHFESRDIIKLTDQNATRTNILHSIENHLVAPAAKDDVLLFYFAGHGSQVRNSRSDEADKLDESLVPADSRLGARDIRDKELRPLFNRILDRGALLTVIFDNCHSASGARGTAAVARSRGVEPDLQDVADPSTGPWPEDRGALVISGTEDFDKAWETRDEEGKMHGSFSWAWIRAMRDALPGEPAIETFLRAQARMRAETPYQEPVIAGTTQARLTPLFGTNPVSEREVIAVESARRDGTVILNGGHLNGLAVGSELRIERDDTRLTVTAVRPTRSEARIEQGAAHPQSGALAEIVCPNELELASILLDPPSAAPRYYYAVGIGRNGERVLVFPRNGSVENRFMEPPRVDWEDKYVLLATDEPLPNPWILERNVTGSRRPSR